MCTVVNASFQPKYRLGHPENYLFSLPTKIIFRIKVSKKIFHLVKKTEALAVVHDVSGNAEADMEEEKEEDNVILEEDDDEDEDPVTDRDPLGKRRATDDPPLSQENKRINSPAAQQGISEPIAHPFESFATDDP